MLDPYKTFPSSNALFKRLDRAERAVTSAHVVMLPLPVLEALWWDVQCLTKIIFFSSPEDIALTVIPTTAAFGILPGDETPPRFSTSFARKFLWVTMMLTVWRASQECLRKELKQDP